MRGITRTVTALFTDVVGSTDLQVRLGRAVGEELRVKYLAGMRGALAVHRGTEVKTLGDGIMAVFDSASDALACAVTMQRGVTGHTRRHPDQAVEIRIGLSAGETTHENGDYFGMPIIEASRLCAAAAPGQVLVADVVRVLVGGSGIHRLEPAGAMALKGLPAPTVAWEVCWDPEEESALRVALADDSVLLRQGIAQVLETEGFDVVLQASDADDLLEALPAARPHVVLLDVRMPPTHTVEGLVAAEHIRANYPDVGVVVLSAEVQPAAARRLLDGGTDGIGYLLKERIADIAELSAAIRTVASGGSAIDPEVIARLASAPAA